MIVAGSYDSYTMANSTSLSFSQKLGTIYDVSLGASPYTCDGLTQPAIGGVTLTFNGFVHLSSVVNYAEFPLTVSSISQTNTVLDATDIRSSSESTTVSDFEEVCLINDLGSEKTYIEPVVTNLFFYYPGAAPSVTFNSVSLVCVDGSVFTYLDVWE